MTRGDLVRGAACVAFVAALVAHSAGCTVAAVYLQPRTTKVRTEKRTASLYVSSEPAGAVVSHAGGTNRTPADERYEYDVVRKHRARSAWWVIGAAVVSLGVGTTALLMLQEDHLGYGLGAMGLTVLDAVAGGTYGSVAIIHWDNRARYDKASTTPVPVDVEVRLVWPDGVATTKTVRLPEQRSILVEHPMRGSYEAALIDWAEAAARSPSPAGLYELGRAYAQRAALSGAPAHVAAAIAYYEQYLATADVPDDRRREVTEAIASLRATAGTQ